MKMIHRHAKPVFRDKSYCWDQSIYRSASWTESGVFLPILREFGDVTWYAIHFTAQCKCWSEGKVIGD